jgi:hypothetical protein
MSEKTFVPHDQVEPGLWYLRKQVQPFYTVVHVQRMVLGPDEGKLYVWLIDEEGGEEIRQFDDDQFIGPVPPPENL